MRAKAAAAAASRRSVSRTGREMSADGPVVSATGGVWSMNGVKARTAPPAMLLSVVPWRSRLRGFGITGCRWTDVCRIAARGGIVAVGRAWGVATCGVLESSGGLTAEVGCCCRRTGFREPAAPARRACGCTAGLGAATC